MRWNLFQSNRKTTVTRNHKNECIVNLSLRFRVENYLYMCEKSFYFSDSNNSVITLFFGWNFILRNFENNVTIVIVSLNKYSNKYKKNFFPCIHRENDFDFTKPKKYIIFNQITSLGYIFNFVSLDKIMLFS